MSKKDLSATLDELKKEYGKTHFSLENDGSERISSGIISIDKVFGGGLPLRRIVEIFGNESSGKTGICLQFAKKVLESGKHVCYIDAEHGLDPGYAKAFGFEVDGPNFILARTDFGEEVGDIIIRMLDHEEIGLIVVDSVPSITPRAETEGDIGDSHMGLAARLMGQILRMAIPKLTKSNASIVFINQVRETMGGMPGFQGPNETTPGGRALRFYSSVRCRTSRVKTMLDGDNPIGIRLKVKNIKNKTARPYLSAETDLLFASGFSQFSDLFDNAIEAGAITARGAWTYCRKGEEEVRLENGRDKTIELLRDNPELYQDIYQKTLSMFSEKMG